MTLTLCEHGLDSESHLEVVANMMRVPEGKFVCIHGCSDIFTLSSFILSFGSFPRDGELRCWHTLQCAKAL